MKICIVGISGAGKTTLAKKLSIEFNTPNYGYDDVYWDKSGGEYIKNHQHVIESLVSNIKSQDAWIVEGAYDRRMVPFFESCSLIIRLKTPYWLCMIRIVKRFLWSKIVATTPKETVANTFELLDFAKQFDRQLDQFFASNPHFSPKIITIDDAKQCSTAIKRHLSELK